PAIGLVPQRFVQPDETIAARLHHGGQGREAIRVELVRVKQEDLRKLTSEQAARDVFDEREDGLHVPEVVVAQSIGPGRVAPAEGVRVGGGVDVFVVVDGDGGNRVTAAGQEGLEGPPLLELEADVQERMTEVAERAV